MEQQNGNRKFVLEGSEHSFNHNKLDVRANDFNGNMRVGGGLQDSRFG